jgi:5-formaminoimidazole-4-carboxamide-1-beta-D-ribofuranosyl 5'-monophosphate synthetase
MDINEALEALSFDLDISLDLEAVMSSPLAEMVDPYVQQGYVQLDNGRVLIRASLQDSVLTLNDEETAVGQFF